MDARLRWAGVHNEWSVIFNEKLVDGREYNRWGAGTARGLKRDKVVKIAWLSGYKNFVGKRDREKFIFNAFVESRLSVGLTG